MATATQQPVSTARYTVTSSVTSAGLPVYHVFNNRTGRIAASGPDKLKVERWAAFLNEDAEPEIDRDWVPGSNSNWWARNGGEAA